MKRLRAWWQANVIDTDAAPEYSALDLRDGLYDDEPAFTALAARTFPGGAS